MESNLANTNQIKEIAAYPHSNYRITCMVDYNSEVLGSKNHTLNKISKFIFALRVQQK